MNPLDVNITFSREEMDRRIMMMVQVDEGIWNSLLELDALMQEKKSLANQLEDFTLNEYDNPVTLLIYKPSVLFY